MTAKELKYIYIEETMSILDNEELMRAVLEAVRKVKKSFVHKDNVTSATSFGGVSALQFSLDELKERLERSEADRVAGRFTSSDDVFQELGNEYPFLCK